MLGGMGIAMPLPVPRAAIEVYVKRLDLDDGEIGEFIEIVAALDDYFVELEAKRILADTKADAEKRKMGRAG